MKGTAIVWTDEMITRVVAEFPSRFNKELASELSVSWRSLVRKARQLGIEKETDFLGKNRSEITKMATAALPENPNKGNKDFRIPGAEKHQFKKGNVPISKDPIVRDKMRCSRNELIRKEKLRIKYGLPQKTKLKLNE